MDQAQEAQEVDLVLGLCVIGPGGVYVAGGATLSLAHVRPQHQAAGGLGALPEPAHPSCGQEGDSARAADHSQGPASAAAPRPRRRRDGAPMQEGGAQVPWVGALLPLSPAPHSPQLPSPGLRAGTWPKRSDAGQTAWPIRVTALERGSRLCPLSRQRPRAHAEPPARQPPLLTRLLLTVSWEHSPGMSSPSPRGLSLRGGGSAHSPLRWAGVRLWGGDGGGWPREVGGPSSTSPLMGSGDGCGPHLTALPSSGTHAGEPSKDQLWGPSISFTKRETEAGWAAGWFVS